jgi:adenosylhomocysteine nucleosidase
MIGIIGAMENEVTMLRDSIEDITTEKVADFDFYWGKLEQRAVVLLRCGVGKVNAAVGCALLITRFHPDFVINTGSAGGIDPSLKVGDAIISNGLLYHDVDITAFGYEPGQLPNMPAVFPVPEGLISQAEMAIAQLKKEGSLSAAFNSIRGLIGSGDVFMHDPEWIGKIRRLFPKIRAVEMEGAAIAHTCRIFGVPALIIRALSDIAGEESPVKFDEFLPVASKHSGEIVKRIVKNYNY